jgi:hypothetical protein
LKRKWTCGGTRLGKPIGKAAQIPISASGDNLEAETDRETRSWQERSNGDAGVYKQGALR